MNDKKLEEELLKRLRKLAKRVDYIGDTVTRRALDEHIVSMYKIITK